VLFLTNPLHASLLAKEQETPPHAWREASFMVNKTSTIKRISAKGPESAGSGTPEMAFKKCEADVQLQMKITETT
jgi:hypothetical protein